MIPSLPQPVPLLLGETGTLTALPQWLIAVAGIVGVVLWLFGHTTLKIGFGAIGLLAGGLGGYIIPGVLGAGIHPIIPAAIGAVIGLVAGFTSFRLSVSLVQGSVGAVIGALMMFIAVAPDKARELRDETLQGPARGLELEVSAAAGPAEAGAVGQSEPSDASVDEVTKSLDTLSKGVREGTDLGPAVDLARARAEDLREETRRLADRVRPVWNDLSREHRTAVALAGVGMGTLGLGLGLFFPKRSGAMVTAIAGAMLWVPALLELMDRGGIATGVLEQATTLRRIAAIALIAVIGTCIQWAMTRRSADKA